MPNTRGRAASRSSAGSSAAGLRSPSVWSPAPATLNSRNATACNPSACAAAATTASASTLLLPYGFTGCSGVCSDSEPGGGSPYTAALEARTIPRAPVSAIAVTSEPVPSTLVRWYPAGSRIDSAAFLRAARCATASAWKPASARRTASVSVTHTRSSGTPTGTLAPSEPDRSSRAATV